MVWSKTPRLVCLVAVSLFLLPLASASSTFTLPQLSEKYQSELFAISSNNEALRFYTNTLQVDLQLSKTRSRTSRNSPSKQHALHRQDDILALVTNMLASRLAATIRTTSQQENKIKKPQFIDDKEPGYQWAQTQSLSPSMKKALSFNTRLSKYIVSIPFPSNPPQHFGIFAQYVDQQYPELTDTSESWVGLLEEGNTSALSDRLAEYWSQDISRGQLPASTSGQIAQTTIDGHAHYYFWTRLWPIFKTHLIALTIQAEAEATQVAQQTLRGLRKMKNEQLSKNVISRICGTWHWTVHNHQNHGDHKMTMVLGKTTRQSTPQPQPAEIKVNGNTVYLFWKFPRGFQEDSLLLSNNDKRLEGTFVNSLGPYGSIMGKRMTTCKP